MYNFRIFIPLALTLMKKIQLLAIVAIAICIASGSATAQQCVWAKAAKSSGGLTVNAFTKAVAADISGNVYAAGEYSSDSVSFGSVSIQNCCANANGIYVARYNTAGALSWVRPFGNSGAVNCYGAATDASGNVYVLGNFMDTIVFGSTTFISNTGADVFLVKLSPAGNVLWAKQGKGAAGHMNYQSTGVATDNSQNVVIAGYFEDSITFGGTALHSLYSVSTFITKYDSSGNLTWSHAAPPGEPGAIATDASGNIFLTGATGGDTTFFSSSVYFLGSHYNMDAFVVKYNSAGNAIWARGAIATSDAYSTLVATDATGNAFISGSFYGATMNIGAYTLTNPDSNNSDVYIAKYDANGNLLWVKNNTGSYITSGSAPMALAVDPAGSPVLSVFCDTPITFGSLSYSGNVSAIVKFSSTGTPLWFWGSGSTSAALLFSLSMDGTGHLYAGGPYGSPIATFDTVTLTNAHTPFSNGYVAKFINVSSGIEDINMAKAEALLYPNPAGDKLNICSTTAISDVVIVNLLGQAVKSVMPGSNTVEIDIHDLSPGVYFARINRTEVQKFEKL